MHPQPSPRALGTTVYQGQGNTPRYLPSSSSLVVNRQCPVPEKPNPYQVAFNTDSVVVLRALENMPAFGTSVLQGGNHAKHPQPSMKHFVSIPPFANVTAGPELLPPALTPRTNTRATPAGVSLDLTKVHQMRGEGEGSLVPAPPSRAPSMSARPASSNRSVTFSSATATARSIESNSQTNTTAAALVPAPPKTPRSGQSARVPPAYHAPEASHWVSTSRSTYVKPTDIKAPERYIGPGKTLVKELPKSAFVGTVESGHFRSRYQVDFGSQPGRRPTFETATTHDLDIGTPRSHPNYIAGTTTHIPSSQYTTARVVPLTRKFNHVKDFPMSSYQYNMQGYSGHQGRQLNAAFQTSHSDTYRNFATPQYAQYSTMMSGQK